MSVARFIADQRTFYRVPYAVCCAILGVSVSWLYKWLDRPATVRQRRRAELDAEVLRLFVESKRTYDSPRIHADLVEAGWTVSVNTVADSMRRQGLQGRKPKRSKGLTRQDRTAPKFPDLLKRDFTAPAPNLKCCGDITEIPSDALPRRCTSPSTTSVTRTASATSKPTGPSASATRPSTSTTLSTRSACRSSSRTTPPARRSPAATWSTGTPIPMNGARDSPD